MRYAPILTHCPRCQRPNDTGGNCPVAHTWSLDWYEPTWPSDPPAGWVVIWTDNGTGKLNAHS